MHFWVILRCVQIKWQTTGSCPRPERSRHAKSLKLYYSSCNWMKTKNKLRKTLHCPKWLHNHCIIFFLNQSKAEINHLQGSVLSLFGFLFLGQLFAPSEMFRCSCGLDQRTRYQIQVKMGRDLLFERGHLLCQKKRRPEAWKTVEKSPTKRYWQFLNSKGICRTASRQRLQEV